MWNIKTDLKLIVKQPEHSGSVETAQGYGTCIVELPVKNMYPSSQEKMHTFCEHFAITWGGKSLQLSP